MRDLLNPMIDDCVIFAVNNEYQENLLMTAGFNSGVRYHKDG
jgi:hypothetical protein